MRLGIAIGWVAGLVLLFACEAAPRPAPAASARVVSLAPSVTELVCALGHGSRLVGVTSHCDFPAEVATIAKVGGYGAPNVEVVLNVAPDLVLVPAEGALRGAVEQLRALSVRVEPIEVRSLRDLYAACRSIGQLLGDEAAGNRLAERLEGRAHAISSAVAHRPHVRTLVIVDHAPIVAAGRDTFIDGLLTSAGGENAAAATVSAWPQLSVESILALEPAVIVDLSMVAQKSNAEGRRGLPDLPTLKGVRIIVLPPDPLVRPGPRLIDGLQSLAHALHPEAFTAR